MPPKPTNESKTIGNHLRGFLDGSDALGDKSTTTRSYLSRLQIVMSL